MFDIVTIETSSLGDRSYLATDGRVAVVVDPQRDIDRLQDLLARLDVRLTHVLETHVHNDYVSGGLVLSQVTGAAYVLPAHSHVEFDHVSVADGDTVSTGEMVIGAMHTPGHTHHHISYTLADSAGRIEAVFTGGSMLYGSTGRTDLVSPADTDELTHAQYHSVRRLARELPADAKVFPSHGFGSFCAATPTSGDSSTVGEQEAVNPALTQDEQEYVDGLLAGLDAYPAYYTHMAPINRAEPSPPTSRCRPRSIPPSCGPGSTRASGWSISGGGPPSPPVTWPGPSVSNCRRVSSPTSAGSTATARR